MKFSEEVIETYKLIHKGAKNALSMDASPSEECITGLSKEELSFAAKVIPTDEGLKEHLLLLPKWFTLGECTGLVQALSFESNKPDLLVYLIVLGFYSLEKEEYVDARMACAFANNLDIENSLLEELIRATSDEISPKVIKLTRDVTYKVRADSYKKLELGEVRY